MCNRICGFLFKSTANLKGECLLHLPSFNMRSNLNFLIEDRSVIGEDISEMWIRQSYINIARLGSIHSLKRPCDVENLSSTSVFIHKPYRVDHLSRKTPRCYVS